MRHQSRWTEFTLATVEGGELGGGAVATVHLAHHLKYHRDVAIKVLHPDLGAPFGVSGQTLSTLRAEITGLLVAKQRAGGGRSRSTLLVPRDRRDHRPCG